VVIQPRIQSADQPEDQPDG
jgi:hypothetical protein